MSLTVFFEIFELVIVNFLQRWQNDEICEKIATILNAKKELLWALKDDICGEQKYEKISKIYALVDYFKLSKFECDCIGMKRKSVNDTVEIVFFEQLNERFCEEYEAGNPIISDKEYDKFLKKLNKKYPNLIKKMKKEYEISANLAPNYPKVGYSDININEELNIEAKYDGVCVISKRNGEQLIFETKNGNCFKGAILKYLNEKCICFPFSATYELIYKNHSRTELVGLLNRNDETLINNAISCGEIVLIKHGTRFIKSSCGSISELRTFCRKLIKSEWTENGIQSDGVVINDGVNSVYVKDYVNFSKKTKTEKK